MSQAPSLLRAATSTPPAHRPLESEEIFNLRPGRAEDRLAVADLLHKNHSARRDRRGRGPAPACRPGDMTILPDIHARLEGNHGLVAVDGVGQFPVGVCFSRAHGKHARIGALAVHPSQLGRGVAAALVIRAVGDAEKAGAESVTMLTDAGHPDLVAINDRLGFSTRQVFFSFHLPVPAAGLAASRPGRTRRAGPRDIVPLAEFDHRVTDVMRIDDLALALSDESGLFQTHVAEDENGRIAGFAVATDHCTCAAVGPLVAEDEQTAGALIAAAAGTLAGKTARVLAPTGARGLIALLYSWDARLGDVHLLQARGAFRPQAGLVMPGPLLGG
ncbi:MAG: GNAT family N-acetyltransferase [Alphaproteobacteria bacterium]|nr:GNAT family N-acetyltransferase [Alphaproteobacteria bacterium]